MGEFIQSMMRPSPPHTAYGWWVGRVQVAAQAIGEDGRREGPSDRDILDLWPTAEKREGWGTYWRAGMAQPFHDETPGFAPRFEWSVHPAAREKEYTGKLMEAEKIGEGKKDERIWTGRTVKEMIMAWKKANIST